VQQGSVLSPLLFNIFLEYCLKDSPVLAKAIKDGKLITFADDILLICDDVKEAEELI
jgi:hypothetical protein